jgi:hypothetical protein
MILPRFSKCIEIMNSEDNENNNMIGIKIRNKYSNNIRRNKKITINDFHNSRLFFTIKERDPLTVSASAK